MRALLLAALLVLAGCVGPAAPGSGSPPSSTTTQTGTRTSTPLSLPDGPCTADRPSPTNTSGEVEPVAYPHPPAELTNESVLSYVEAFERAFLHNRRLVTSAPVRYLEVYVDDLSVRRYGDAVVVRLHSYTNGGSLQEQEDGTPIVVHWDGAPTPASYLVMPDRVIRATGSNDHVSLSRLRNGTTLECF